MNFTLFRQYLSFTGRALALAFEFKNPWFITDGLTKQSLIDPKMSVDEFEHELKCKNVALKSGLPDQWQSSIERVYREASERYILATKSKFLENSLKESFGSYLNYLLKKDVNKVQGEYLKSEIQIDSLEVNHFAWLNKYNVLIIRVNATGKEYYYRNKKQHLDELDKWQDYIVLARDNRNEQWKIINLIQEGKILEN